MHSALFLDRDGVINIDYGYVHKKEDFIFNDGIFDLVSFATSKKYANNIKKIGEETFDKIVSSNDPFGFDVRVKGGYKRVKPTFSLKKESSRIPFYYRGWKKDGLGFIDKKLIKRNLSIISKSKIFIPKAWGAGKFDSDKLDPILVNGNSCSTETYLIISSGYSDKELNNICSYINTKFFHMLTLTLKNTQNAMKKVYSLVPLQDFTREWNDRDLYKKYNLSSYEIHFIESNVLQK